MTTLLLTVADWDLTLDTKGNIAVADEDYGLAQDAASSIKTFLGEYYWDTTIGVPYMSQILAKRPSVALLKQLLITAALQVPDVAAAQVYLTALSNRVVSGQVQVISQTTGQLAAANFSAVNPQGA